MKSGYKKLLIFEISILLVFFLNNFVSSILGDYAKVIFLFILLIIFRFLLGFEKDRHYLWKNVCIEILIFLLIYFILYYLLGIIISFTKIKNYFNVYGIFNVFIPLILIIVLKEILRYMMLKKAEGSKLMLVLTCITFVVVDLFGMQDTFNFTSPYTTFIFIALTLLPIISNNIACSYISYRVGYKPVILYLLIIQLYQYIIPIVPNPNEYFYSIIYFVVPFALMYHIYRYLKRGMDEDIERDYHKRKFGALVLPTIIMLFMVYITSGYFHYHAIVIASGSMEKQIHKGDVVVIEKIDDNYDLLKINQVIAYRYKDLIIVHRLVKKVETGGETIYYTKGDANNAIDNYKITKDMIIGVVNVKVPYIGLPTVWVKNL